MNFNLDFLSYIDIGSILDNGSFWVVIFLQVFIVASILFIHYHFARFSPDFDIWGKAILFVMDLLFLIVIYFGFQYFAELYFN